MITALASTNANPSMGNEARTFDRFVGTWDCDFSFHLDDGSVRHKRGELLFGWLLDGRAVQDIWITYPADGQKDHDRHVAPVLRYGSQAVARDLRRPVIQLRGQHAGETGGRSDRPRGHGFRRPPDPLVFQ